MKKQFLWAALAIAVLTPTAFLEPAQSAIPPLSEQELQKRSTHVVSGIVTSIQSQRVTTQYGYNFEHTAKVQIARVDRSIGETVKPGQLMKITYTMLGNNGGRSGSQRQQLPLTQGLKAKLFIFKGQDGKFYLLEPNGWKPIQTQD